MVLKQEMNAAGIMVLHLTITSAQVMPDSQLTSRMAVCRRLKPVSQIVHPLHLQTLPPSPLQTCCLICAWTLPQHQQSLAHLLLPCLPLALAMLRLKHLPVMTHCSTAPLPPPCKSPLCSLRASLSVLRSLRQDAQPHHVQHAAPCPAPTPRSRCCSDPSAPAMLVCLSNVCLLSTSDCCSNCCPPGVGWLQGSTCSALSANIAESPGWHNALQAGGLPVESLTSVRPWPGVQLLQHPAHARHNDTEAVPGLKSPLGGPPPHTPGRGHGQRPRPADVRLCRLA